VTTEYDGFGRVTSSTITMLGFSRTLSYLYDAGGKRIRITHPDGKAFGYVYDGLDRMTYVHDNPSITSADDYVARYFYKPEGPRYVAIRGVGPGGFTTVYHYDPVQRLALMGNDLAGTAADMTVTLGYNPAGQIRQYDRDNNAYAWTGTKSVNRDYAANGQNQYTTAGDATFAYDKNGNLISTRNAPWSTDYVYDVENRLVSASGTHSAFLVYDPLGRLAWFSGPSTGMTQFLYDGDDLVAEYNGAGTLTRRYVHGPDTDDPVAAYEGAALGTAGRRYMLPDERGSIAVLVDANGTPVSINSYDEYGIPGADNQGRFQYTGQAWIGELGLYYYKSRLYSPFLGRFLQVDTIGYDGGINLYAYVDNDPVNEEDPTGECPMCWGAVVGGLIDGGIEAGSQLYSSGKITSWGAVGRATGRGAVTGAVTGGLGNVARLGKVLGTAARSGRVARAGTAASKSKVAIGPHAGKSIPARSAARDFSAAERRSINRIGSETGCHSCGSRAPGTKSGNFVPDHQPPSSINGAGKPQRLYPQCLQCSRQQGLELARQARGSLP
jgi:RHS repeat-associated protein